MIDKCPNGLLPDGPICPRCGGNRGPSGVDGGSWVHCPPEAYLDQSLRPRKPTEVEELRAANRALQAEVDRLTRAVQVKHEKLMEIRAWDIAHYGTPTLGVEVAIRYTGHEPQGEQTK